MIFLSSLPRSGSTLLTSLLNQRGDVYATPTSNLADTMGAAVMAWEQNPTTKAGSGEEEDIIRILRGIQAGRYDTDKLVIDKSRGWADPTILSTMEKVQGEVKIIATVRPVADCLASFVKVAGPDNVNDFCKRGELAAHLFQSYRTLKAGYEAHPDKFLLIEYDDLVADAAAQMDRVADFIGLDHYDHDLANVPDSGEVDEAWGIDGLHKVRPQVRKRTYSPRNLLGEKLYNFYQGGEFWNDKPEPVKEKTPIQWQHDALMDGDFDKSKRLAYENLLNWPDDSDIAFNAGWAKLSDGDLRRGYELLDKGRETMVWGDPHFGSTQPIWDGDPDHTVLLRLERGLGDQIHQVRYARDLKAAGCTVVVSCQGQLAPALRHAEGVDVVVQHEAACGVYHDSYLPAMSAPIQLGYTTNDNIDGRAYIPCPNVEVVPGRIGLRWSGLPAYEHQTKRLFPHELLFNVVKGRGECISLQRDEGSEHRPDWVAEVPLDDWGATCRAIASCEMVITSCTSIAHMAGALGVSTYVMVPHVPYYLWTWPGMDTPYYDSLTLLRQTNNKEWLDPFKALAGVLEERLANAA
jgi:hypothetical protein